MKKLNQDSTKIFCKLLDKISTKSYLKLTVDGFMPLTIEKIDNEIQTPWGKGVLISLAHYYELNGDLMRDPEVVFIVVDNREKPEQLNLIGIYPQIYQQDNMGIYEESISIKDCRVETVITKWQHAHCSFSNQWLKNIKYQGFLTC